MIYALWLCCSMKYFNMCCQLLLMTVMFDLAMTTQSQQQLHSQGNKNEPPSENAVNLNFCKENVKSLLNYNSYNLEISSLSSKRGPSSSSDRNYPSSRNTSLPQGSLNRVTFTLPLSSTKVSRIFSDTLKPSVPMAGCISLLNYYWRYNVSYTKEESLFGVQIFIFHLDNNSDSYLTLNLNILLHSTQDDALLRPVTIVLSSFLPRRFYISVLSYLSLTQQPIHIILTNVSSDVIIVDRDLDDADMARIFISVLDTSYNHAFQFTSNANVNDYIVLDKNIEEIRERFVQTNLYKNGQFLGFRYNSISANVSPQMLWLFDNELQYSKRKPKIRLVVIEIIGRSSNVINIVLGKKEGQTYPHYNELYQEQCVIVNNTNYVALEDRVSTLQKTKFSLDERRTCSYFVNPSSLSSLKDMYYKTVTWLHFEELTNINLALSSARFSKPNDVHLVILTAKSGVNSTINIESFLLHKRVHILSNISRNQLKQPNGSSSLISLDIMNTSPKNGATQAHWVASYIARSSSAVMQTTVYKLKPAETYEILVNVDDSHAYSYDDVTRTSTCWYYSRTNITLSLTINLTIWKHINRWTPSQFFVNKRNQVFKRVDNTTKTFTKTYSSIQNNFKIYGIWRDTKYLLNLPFNYHCTKPKKIENKTKIQQSTTTVFNFPTFIPKSEQGFNVFNDSKFKTLFKNNGPLHDKDRIFVQLTQNIVDEISLFKGIQLRDCYISNQMAYKMDLKYSNKGSSFKKLHIIKEGCINQTSSLYSNIDKTMRPMNHYKIDNLMYRFSVGIDANNWATRLSLQRQWIYNNRIEVHLYCGLNRCYKSISSDLSKDTEKCPPSNECSQKFKSEQTYKYFGKLTIIKEVNTVLKISILIVLSIVTLLLFLFLVLYLWKLNKFRSRYKHNPSPIRADRWRTSSFDTPTVVTKRPKSKLDYHSLKLLSGTRKPLVRLYSGKHPQSSSPTCSMQQLIVDNDRSIILVAGYLSSPCEKKETPLSNTQIKSSTHPARNSRLLSHSISEICLSDNNTGPVVFDKALYSWPLSSADRHQRCHHSQPPPRQHSFRSFSNRDRYRLTLSSKLKISVTFTSDAKSFTYLSNQKLSSNRTTVSGGESASAASDYLPTNNNKFYKLWSPLSNCTVNNNNNSNKNHALVTSRN